MDTAEARLLALEECTEKLEAQLRLHQEGNAAHVDCHDALAQRMETLEQRVEVAHRRLDNASGRITSSENEHDALAQRVAELERCTNLMDEQKEE
jgi:predicted  nucleic acid-binding Zn-ribbon protein